MKALRSSPGGVRLTSLNERQSPQPEGRASAEKAALNVSVSSTIRIYPTQPFWNDLADASSVVSARQGRVLNPR